MVLADINGIILLKITFYFVGILLGWFAFYFLIDALKKVEAFTKKKTGWKLIYLSLPFLVMSPIARLHSFWAFGKILYGTNQAIANAFFMLSGLIVFIAIYSFKRHLEIKLISSHEVFIAFLVALGTTILLLSRITDFTAFASMVFVSLGLFFLALSLWIIASYTKEFDTIYPMSVFLLSSALLMVLAQVMQGYAFALSYTTQSVFVTLDFAGDIFLFIAFLVAAISTYVFKKTVIDFPIHIAKSKKP